MYFINTINHNLPYAKPNSWVSDPLIQTYM